MSVWLFGPLKNSTIIIQQKIPYTFLYLYEKFYIDASENKRSITDTAANTDSLNFDMIYSTVLCVVLYLYYVTDLLVYVLPVRYNH